MRVGLFDSGMGGLTVLKVLRKKYPDNDYIYYGDNLNVPYGNKSIDELKDLADKNIRFLFKKNVDMIIIACGTISSTCYDMIKDKYGIPIYDIISPTLAYLNKSKNENILVMATARTIESHIFSNRVKKNVYELETPELASLIEDGQLDNIHIVLDNYLRDYVGKIDSLVLGCTHYPVIIPEIKEILGKVKIINMASMIRIPNQGNGTLDIYFGKVDDKVTINVKRILENDDVMVRLANVNSK